MAPIAKWELDYGGIGILTLTISGEMDVGAG